MASVINTRSTTRSKKPPARKKHASPSMISLFSNATHNSNGSNESNATVTPESVARSRQRSSTTKSNARRSTTTTRHATKRISARASPTASPLEERPPVDVFAFMEQDEDDAAEQKHAAELDGVATRQELRIQTNSKPPDTAARQSLEQIAMQYQTLQEARLGWDNISKSVGVHSDSGISVRSSSPERESPVLHYRSIKKRLSQPTTTTSTAGPSHSSTQFHTTSSRVLGPFDEIPDMSPEAFYSVASRPTMQHAEYETTSDHLPCHRSVDLNSTHEDHDPELEAEGAASTFDLAAHSVSSNEQVALKPIYRKFESLNNRVLLHLQSEISDLEDDLKHVDAAVVASTKAAQKDKSPQHEEMRSTTPLQWRRKELIERILAKLDQYNRNLSSYSNLTRGLDTACPRDITAYSEWLALHNDLADLERTFLNHATDLTTIRAQHAQEPQQSDRTAITTGCAILMTIITFKLVPELLSRLVIGIVVGGAMVLCGSPPATLNEGCLREYGRRAAVYGGVVVVLAFTVG